MIKTILFDYGGTLANSNTNWDVISDRIAARLKYDNISVDPIDLENAIKDTINFRYVQHQNGVELNSYEFFNHALGILEQSINLDITDELEQFVYEETYTEFVTGLEDILIRLSKDYKLALVSNSWFEGPRQTLRDYGYSGWFDVLLCSFDIGIPKPDPRIFEFALDILGVSPNEAVMVGDNLEVDIKGALRMGMQAVLVDDGFSEYSGHKIFELDEITGILQRINAQ